MKCELCLGRGKREKMTQSIGYTVLGGMWCSIALYVVLLTLSTYYVLCSTTDRPLPPVVSSPKDSHKTSDRDLCHHTLLTRNEICPLHDSNISIKLDLWCLVLRPHVLQKKKALNRVKDMVIVMNND